MARGWRRSSLSGAAVSALGSVSPVVLGCGSAAIGQGNLGLPEALSLLSFTPHPSSSEVLGSKRAGRTSPPADRRGTDRPWCPPDQPPVARPRSPAIPLGQVRSLTGVGGCGLLAKRRAAGRDLSWPVQGAPAQPKQIERACARLNRNSAEEDDEADGSRQLSA